MNNHCRMKTNHMLLALVFILNKETESDKKFKGKKSSKNNSKISIEQMNRIDLKGNSSLLLLEILEKFLKSLY